MSILRKWIEVLVNNVFLKGRNNADSADVDILKVNASDKIEFGDVPLNPSSRTINSDYQLIDKKYFDDNNIGGSGGLTLEEAQQQAIIFS